MQGFWAVLSLILRSGAYTNLSEVKTANSEIPKHDACTQIVYSLGPMYLYGDFRRPKYIIFGYLDPWGDSF